MRKAQNDRLAGLSFLVGYSCLVGGAAVLVGSLVLMAFWRNNDPVAGPPIHELPVIRGITGEYVALGDSYAAGEGLRPFEAFTGDNRGELGNSCHRSQLAYSQLLRFEAPVPATRFVACSGAVISDIFKPYLTGEAGDDDRLAVPEQVPAGVRRDVGLVTISIGGNDAVFSAIVRHCFFEENCLEKQFTPPPDDLDRAVDLPDPLPLDDWADVVLRGGGAETVESKIRAVYARLRTTYPNGRASSSSDTRTCSPEAALRSPTSPTARRSCAASTSPSASGCASGRTTSTSCSTTRRSGPTSSSCPPQPAGPATNRVAPPASSTPTRSSPSSSRRSPASSSATAAASTRPTQGNASSPASSPVT